MVAISLQPINDDYEQLQRFLEGAGDLGGFRYFSKRPLSVISQHVATFLLFENNEPIAYGHLDPEDDVIWLGIAVAESARGEGWGKLMMNVLLQAGKRASLPFIQLAVDRDNVGARQLYQAMGFLVLEERAHYCFMRKDL